jgi:hypothetical protein
MAKERDQRSYANTDRAHVGTGALDRTIARGSMPRLWTTRVKRPCALTKPAWLTSRTALCTLSPTANDPHCRCPHRKPDTVHLHQPAAQTSIKKEIL